MHSPVKSSQNHMASEEIPIDASQIGRALKAAREAAGLTQVQAAAAIDVDSVTLSRWERGVRAAPRSARMALERLYGRSIDVPDLAGGLDEQGTWEPNPTLRGVVPGRVYDVAIGYCRRLAAAGLPREEIEEAERLLIDPAYAKLNRKAKRELTDDEQIQIIDATWQIMQEVLSWKGVRA